MNHEPSETDEPIGVTVQEGIAIASPFYPNLITFIQGSYKTDVTRIPIVLCSCVPLVVINHSWKKKFEFSRHN